MAYRAEDFEKKIRTDPRIPEEEKENTIRQFKLESGNFNPDVLEDRRRSSAGARGLAQFMDSTRRDYPHDPSDPNASLNAGIQYMSDLSKQFGDWKLARAAYNAGPGRISSWLKKGARFEDLPAETRNYLEKTGGILSGGTASVSMPARGNALTRTMSQLQAMGILPKERPQLNVDEVYRPHEEKARVESEISQNMFSTAMENFKNRMLTKPTDPEFRGEPQYGPTGSALASLASNIASVLSGNQRYAEQTQAKLMGDEERTRQEGIQRRQEALAYAAEALGQAREQMIAKGNHARAIELAKTQAKVEKDLAELQGFNRISEAVTTQAIQESIQQETQLKDTLLKIGFMETEDGGYAKVGPGVGRTGTGKGSRLPSATDVAKTTTDMFAAIMSSKNKSWQRPAMQLLQSQLVRTVAAAREGDTADSIIDRLKTHKVEIANAMGFTTEEEANNYIKGEYTSTIAQEVSYTLKNGIEEVPGTIETGLQLGLISGEEAMKIPDWRGREDFLKRLGEEPKAKPDYGDFRRREDDFAAIQAGEEIGRARVQGRAGTPTPAPSRTIKGETPEERGTHAGGELTPAERTEAKRLTHLSKLKTAGPPPEPDYSGMGYREQLTKEIGYLEALLRYDSNFITYGERHLKPEDRKNLIDSVRKLKRELDAYERTSKGTEDVRGSLRKAHGR